MNDRGPPTVRWDDGVSSALKRRHGSAEPFWTQVAPGNFGGYLGRGELSVHIGKPDHQF
eukprot:CAMPEP_0174325946 /NCGR_PEP_ID=MMETSP0810-20121108/13588_1 /TAXON_ID=73025 ORGANISM="Eutreptiella gymnastica-like, Strain CCMP1594" /NCGR_SAMPLE_ID=MMETSP0810 /ASSEMBLY_ACC=CAM_ASM_000659 /LENGTH=58 /DNA_ID=CAMNT_0015439427 /DNA_START=326 /DNA_END=502 /DNA_ORIENTATION=+